MVRPFTLSKFMSLVLRHNSQPAGITLDSNGWADTQALIEGMNRKGQRVTFEILKEIVAANDKQRFKFNEDYTKIRANQGHSVAFDVELKKNQPPVVLYHGTAAKFIASIKN